MKRLFWLGFGAAAGASGTVWVERKVRTQLEALQPDHLVVTAGNKAIKVGRNVVDAVLDGRDAMREREFELRGQYQPPSARARRGEVHEVTVAQLADPSPAWNRTHSSRSRRTAAAGTVPRPATGSSTHHR